MSFKLPYWFLFRAARSMFLSVDSILKIILTRSHLGSTDINPKYNSCVHAPQRVGHNPIALTVCSASWWGSTMSKPLALGLPAMLVETKPGVTYWNDNNNKYNHQAFIINNISAFQEINYVKDIIFFEFESKDSQSIFSFNKLINILSYINI